MISCAAFNAPQLKDTLMEEFVSAEFRGKIFRMIKLLNVKHADVVAVQALINIVDR